MKFRVLIVMLTTLLLFTGCANAVGNRLDAVEDAVENRVDRVEDAAESKIQQAAPQTAQTTANTISDEEARKIALEHAGFTTEQVQYLRSQYEIDDGVPQYDVEFHHDRWEYEYEINAETGEILSYHRDD